MRNLIEVLFPRQKISRQEYEESLAEGGIEEPRLFRGLTEQEKNFLEKNFRFSLTLRNNFWWVVSGSLIADFLFLYTLYKFIFENKAGEFFVWSVLLFTILASLQISIVTIALKVTDRYYDLRAPVFKVQGKAVLSKTQKESFCIRVRGVFFNSAEQPDLSSALENIDLAEEIPVEYSPRTKHVWKIYKTEDI